MKKLFPLFTLFLCLSDQVILSASQKKPTPLYFNGIPKLPNCGVSCYANSALQILTAATPITQQLDKKIFVISSRDQKEHQLITLINLIATFPGQKDFTQAKNAFDATLANGQQDIEEFLTSLLPLLAQKLTPNTLTLLVSTFFGLSSDSDVLAPSETAPTSPQYILQLPMCDQNITSLKKALGNYFAWEQLQQKTTAGFDRKKVILQNSPEILIIQLKRFSVDQSQKVEKCDKDIAIDTSINLNPYLAQDVATNAYYDLIAFALHTGQPDRGHYTAYVKRNNLWYFCNDDQIQKKEPGNDLKKGYVFIYQKRSTQLQAQQPQKPSQPTQKQPSQLSQTPTQQPPKPTEKPAVRPTRPIQPSQPFQQTETIGLLNSLSRFTRSLQQLTRSLQRRN